ncbi:hypothetical protein BHE74_00059044 [Ensete ventricosum]|nr:hypothetical protein BHE74_00059044 [Ensete ventricosum]
MVPPSNDEAVAQLPETFAAREPQDSAVDEENLERQRPRVAGEAAVILAESDKDVVRVLGGGRGERREREIATADGWEAVMEAATVAEGSRGAAEEEDGSWGGKRWQRQRRYGERRLRSNGKRKRLRRRC